MLRTFNFTGRKKIPQRMIRVVQSDAQRREFEVHWDAAELGMPQDGRVFVEALSSGVAATLRFDWGTVASPHPPSERSLKDLPGDTCAFTFKVVDTDGYRGRLFGISKNIRLSENGIESGGRQSILPVNVVDLGEQVWRLTFSNNNPWLEVNRRLTDPKELARSDSRFFSLVYPEAIRRILIQAVIIEHRTDPGESEDDWQCKWLKWARFWHPDRSGPPITVEAQENIEWIEDVVASFCRQHEVATRFIAASAE